MRVSSTARTGGRHRALTQLVVGVCDLRQPRERRGAAERRRADGTCLGGPVALDYYDRAPFPFNGHIDKVNVRYTS